MVNGLKVLDKAKVCYSYNLIGTQYYHDGSKYTGEWVNNRREGTGNNNIKL
jgi:hypothetical protein